MRGGGRGGGGGQGGVWGYRIGGVLAEQLFTGALTTDFKAHPKQWAQNIKTEARFTPYVFS